MMAIATLVFGLCALALSYGLLKALYNITLHPLANFPGPKLYGAFAFPWFWHFSTGNGVYRMKELHEKYGRIVRIGPKSVSFTGSTGWRDINAHHKGRKDLIRDPKIHRPLPGTIGPILISPTKDYPRYRRILSHAFSDSALRYQETIILAYCDKLITRLSEVSQDKQKVDLVFWFNSVAFDIMGNLSLGKSFNSLEDGAVHPWMRNIFNFTRLIAWTMCMNHYPYMSEIVYWLMNRIPAVGEVSRTHEKYSHDRVCERLAMDTDRKDFLGSILPHNNEDGLSQPEMVANMGGMIVAGSETIATHLPGLLYLLATHPDKMQKLTAEILSSFTSKSEMNFASEAKLTYLNACINEGLRIYPPTPWVPALMTPEGGIMVDGVWVPGDVSVGVHPYATFLSPSNFKNPTLFHPERWLGDPEYATDDLFASQPFGFGPKMCPGKKIGLAEIRAIMVRFLWRFEVELCEESQNWMMGQKAFMVWEKPELWANLRERVRT